MVVERGGEGAAGGGGEEGMVPAVVEQWREQEAAMAGRQSAPSVSLSGRHRAPTPVVDV